MNLTGEVCIVYIPSVLHIVARRSLPVAVALCLLPVALQAQDVLTEASPKKITKILTSMGLEIQETKGKGESEQPILKFDLAGYQVLLILAKDHTDAQLYVGFGGRQVSAEKVNEWNARHRFARAYRDKDGEPVLESDIDFTGGVTEANIKAWVKLFRDLMGAYSKFVH
jgi:hypothetical protein